MLDVVVAIIGGVFGVGFLAVALRLIVSFLGDSRGRWITAIIVILLAIVGFALVDRAVWEVMQWLS